jgi:uncharacterized protein (TIGR02646 family)
MLNINKNEPAYYRTSKRGVRNPRQSNAWEDKNILKIKALLRDYILSNEQSSLCAYCEKEIDSNSKYSNIDHFKTRNLFPQYTLNYNNLLVSCNSRSHCSHIKDNCGLNQESYRNIIDPVTENPDNYFEYGFAGDIFAKNCLTEIYKTKSEFTIKVFDLNNRSLIEDRKKITMSIKALKEQGASLHEILESLKYYQSFTRSIYSKL